MMDEELEQTRVVADPIESVRCVASMVKRSEDDERDMHSARLKVHHVHRKLSNASSSFRINNKSRVASLMVLMNMVRSSLRDVAAASKSAKTDGTDPWAQALLRCTQEQLNLLLANFKAHSAEVSGLLAEMAQLDEDVKDMQTCLRENQRMMLLIYTNYIDRLSRNEQINDLREFGKVGVEASDREPFLQREDMSSPHARMPVYNRQRPLHEHPFSMTPVITGSSKKPGRMQASSVPTAPVPVSILP